MSDEHGQIVEALRASLKETERLRRENERLVGAAREPIALVGIGCRFPGGVSDADGLWRLVSRAQDAIDRFPEDRGWDLDALYHPDPDHSGTSYVREGGFLYDAGDFDAEFFGLSPREALGIDPQHRLLLEVAWEALEHGGLDPLALRGSRTGVFVGTMHHDYGGDPSALPPSLEGYLGSGNPGSAASGIVSYSLGLEGPAVSVDTACSSSLVALHLACQALRQGECSLALAGGVSVMASPGLFVFFSRQRGLAPDGRCKPYSARADGTGTSEGVGIVVLERLSDARRNGHQVLALVRGSAVNQDGASNGMTAPSGPAQERVIRQALASAGLAPHQVSAVEGHGTGTVLGDPIEAQALIETYGRERGDAGPLWLGSVKSNIGHTQAAAGIAGVIKMTMALRHRLLPRTLYAEEPSDEVDWSAGEVSLLADAVAWEADGPRRAGVSSFGASGTNAHAILEEAPAEEPATATDGGPAAVVFDEVAAPWLLSAKGQAALAGQAHALLQRLRDAAAVPPRDVGFSLLARSQHRDRAVVLGEGEELLAGLRTLSAGDSSPLLVRGAAVDADGAVFVFPGQGSQWQGMCGELLQRSPVFAERIDACARALAPHVDWDLKEVLLAADGAPSLERVEVVQPALFAAMVSLAELWRACGVRPRAVVGHSQGEIAAACVAGALSLEDAARVVTVRSRELGRIAGRGGMMSVALGRQEVERRLGRFAGRIVVAAVNGSRSVVVSGEVQALEQLRASCEDEHVRARLVPVDYAAHSPQVQEIREALLAGCEGVQARASDVPFYSSVSGGLLDGSALDAEYWYRNLRETVRFDAAVGAVLADAPRPFVEVSPHPVLGVGLEECVERNDGESVPVLCSLRRGEGGPARFLASLAHAWVHGVPVDWHAIYRSHPPARRVALPTYAFQRRRYWHVPTGAGADVLAAGVARAGHPLLGAALAPAGADTLLLTGRLSLPTQPWLADHAVLGATLLPGTALAELALHAGTRCGCEKLAELTLLAPLVLEEQGAVRIQVQVDGPDERGTRVLRVYSRPDGGSGADELLTGPDEEGWTLNASGSVCVASGEPSDQGWPSEQEWPPVGARGVEIGDLYARLADLGLDYGPSFQGLRGLWRRGEEIFAEVSLPEQARAQAGSFGLHPALFDAAVHGYAAALLERDGTTGPEGGDRLRLPFALSGVTLHARGASALRVRLSPAAGSDSVALSCADERGTPVLEVRSLSLRSLAHDQLAPGASDSLYKVAWRATAASAPVPLGRWVTVGARAESLARKLRGLDDAGAGDGARADVEVHAGAQALRQALDGGAAPPETALAFFAADVEQAAETTVRRAHELAREALELVQSWLADERLAGSRLVFVTRNAVAVRGGDPVEPACSTVWGLARSIQSEEPGRLVLVDLDSEPASWRALAGALASGEPQLAIRDGAVLTARLTRLRSDPGLAPPAGAAAWRLQPGRGGTLEDLSLVATDAAAAQLAAEEVRVEVRAAGVNFRDVVCALGMVPLREGEDAIGSEGAGVVLEVGAGVADLAPGDRVMGLMFGSFGTKVVADRRMLVAVPDGWSFVRAASVCGAFLTAWYGLFEVAGLRAGERVLIHAAAGGVGMAAVQLARHVGAEVWATANPSKWQTLRELGVADGRIASSRDLDFRERFLAASGGEGVDVVLNSLAGEYVDASCQLLPRGGRFVEMGKTDVRDAHVVAAAHPGVVYRAFDLLEAGPELIGRMLAKIAVLLQGGVLAALPTRIWDVRRAPEAMRFMGQAKHVGKLVLTIPRSKLDGGGTALITGGTGGLGALTARHLVREHGVRGLVLVSRRGGQAPGAAELARELRELGAEVTLAACDVSRREGLARLIEAIPPERPLRVVVHSAAVLDDGTVGALSAERLDRVLAPKLDAAWHLHELTRELDLDAFVLFSSVAGTLGGPGQANYAAANAFLDALAAHRRTLGLPAVSMAWGGWEQPSGMTGGLEAADLARVRRAGVGVFSSEQGLRLFDAALAAGEALVAPVRLDLAALRAQARRGATPAILGDLVRVSAAARPARSAPLRERLDAASPRARRGVAVEFVRAEIATVLGHSTPEAIDVDRAFKELGFDSLLAVELRNRLKTATGLLLPSTLVFDYPTPAALADQLLARLADDRADAAASERPAAPVAAGAEEPFAIVGMSCRFPGGVRSARDLWELVAAGTDAVGAFPGDRGWDLDTLFDDDPDSRGTSYGREGAFVYDATEFDAAFFGISPREALAMDPQQRLLLEAAWEALEDAGLDPLSLRGSQTGVFAGIGSSSYGAWAPDSAEADGFQLTGSFGSVASGRVAYALGLEGPAVSLDTACSSSLVALHLACDALRTGECTLALAGGVSLMSTPHPFVEFSRQRALARDGRCKPFADAADGTGWGEGVGLLLVERLSDARRSGREVLALVRGSAINQDGASNGLTAPNGPAQQRVIRRALSNARLSELDVDAVEAHGTGTVLGDPIEAQALLATYGRERPVDRPLWLGSVKSNIGHTQHAAGAAGVIKMAMALRHGVLPPTLHVDEPTSQVDWSLGAVSLLTEPTPWPREGRPRRAGVSSFGVSGTNAHVILEEPPEEQGLSFARDASAGGHGSEVASAAPAEPAPAARLTPSGPLPWLLSGRGVGAVRAGAERLLSSVRAADEPSAAAVAVALAGRAQLEDRAVVLGEGRESLLEGLAAVAVADPAAGAIFGTAAGPRSVAFMFTGQGAQRVGMGRELYETVPLFKEALDEVCVELDAQLGRPLLAAIFDTGESGQAALLGDTMLTQAGLFAIEVSLARLLATWGVTPDWLIGHSIGELSAAFLAGVFSLSDASRLVVARGRLMDAAPAQGAMFAVEATEGEALESLAGHEREVSLAAVNGPRAVVLSGVERTAEALARAWSERGRKVKRLRVARAFHSPAMDAVLAAFAAVAAEIELRPPQIPLISNLTGAAVGEELCSPDYWVRHVREPVRFADGVRTLAEQGVSDFLELGPDGVLSAMCDECLHELAAGEPPRLIAATLKPEVSERRSLLDALARHWVGGGKVDWRGVLDGAGPPARGLPTYPFQRRRYWLEGISYSPAANRRGRTPSVSGGWRYRVEWKPIVPSPAAALQGTWLVLVPSPAGDGDLAAILAALREAGARTSTVVFEAEGDGQRAELTERLRAELAGLPDGEALGGVLSLPPAAQAASDAQRGGAFDAQSEAAFDAQSGGASDTQSEAASDAQSGGASDTRSEAAFDAQSNAGLTGALTLVQALIDLGVHAPLWLLTRGAVAVAASDRVPWPSQAPRWGLGATLALERPQLAGGMIDLPAALDARSASLLAAALAGGHEDQLAIRGAGVLARRLARCPDRRSGASERWTPPPGTVLIAGGTGGLGAHIARRLAADGAEHLLLLSRRGEDAPGAAQLREEITALGATATVLACDVGERDQLERAIVELPPSLPLRAVFHAAGVGVQAELGSLSAAELDLALHAKVRGATHLHELTEGEPLAAFVLCSSLAGTLGSARQAAYAAANAHLDALAAHRRARGLAATSVGWGPWQGEGMAAETAVVEALRRHGLEPMAPEPSLDELSGALLDGESHVLIADIDWRTYAPALAFARRRPLIEDIDAARAALHQGDERTEPSVEANELCSRLEGMVPADARETLLKLVRAQAASVLGHDTIESVAPKRAFRDLGFDSLTAVELRNRLEAASGLPLAATLAFDYPTPAALADHLLERLTDAGSPDELARLQLEGLERAVGSLASERKAPVLGQLRGLLARLEADESERAGSQGREAALLIERMRTGGGTDEELFAFIDSELPSGDETAAPAREALGTRTGAGEAR